MIDPNEQNIKKNNLKTLIELKISKYCEEEKLFIVYAFKEDELEARDLIKKGCVDCFVFKVLATEGFNVSKNNFIHSKHNDDSAKTVINAVKESIKRLKTQESGQFRVGFLSLYSIGIIDLGFLFNNLEPLETKKQFYYYMFLFLNNLATSLGIEEQEACYIEGRVFLKLYLETLLEVDDKIVRGKFSFEKLLQLNEGLREQLQKDVNQAVEDLPILKQEILDFYRNTFCVQKTGELLHNKVNYVKKNFLITKEKFLNNLLHCWKVKDGYLSDLDLDPNRYEKSNNEGFIKLLQMWTRELTTERKTINVMTRIFLTEED